MSDSIARRLSWAPLGGSTAADEAPLPPNMDRLASLQYAVMPSSIAPEYATYEGHPFLRISPRLAILSSVGMNFCCPFSEAGYSCRCGGHGRSMNLGGYGGELLGYTMVDTDWPGINWRLGFGGPGPFLEYPEVFPLHGRSNLAPMLGY